MSAEMTIGARVRATVGAAAVNVSVNLVAPSVVAGIAAGRSSTGTAVAVSSPALAVQVSTGPRGPAGADGADGANGADGVDGADGADGTAALLVHEAAPDPHPQYALDPTVDSDVKISSGVWHFERTNGSPGNGTSDDAPWWNDMLAAGKSIVLSDRKQYLLKTPVIFTVADTGIIAPMYATVKVSTAAGAFDNNLFTDVYSRSLAGGKKYAVPIYGEGLDGLFLEKLRIVPNQWPETGGVARYLKPAAFKECDDLWLSELEISGFSRGDGAITLNDCDDALIINPDIHHIWTNITDANSQVTGICIDPDCSVGSKRFKIISPRIRWITMGDACRELRGYQADGISIRGHSTLKPSLDGLISGGTIEWTGEGVDCFGSGTIIEGTNFRRCFLAGVKLAYAASQNLLANVQMQEMGLYGVQIVGGDRVDITDDLTNAAIFNVRVFGINTAGDWANADGGLSYDSALHGARAHDSATNTALRVDLQAGLTSAVTKLEISGFRADMGGTGKYGIVVNGVAGSGAITASRLDLTNYTVDRIVDAQGYLTETDANPAQASGDIIQDAATLDTQLLARHDMISGAWNGSFELGDWNFTQDTTGGIGWTIENAAANARSGNWVAKNADTTSANLSLTVQNRKRVVPGETVYAEAWIKSDAGAAFSTCRIRIQWFDKDGASLSFSAGTNYNTPQTSYVLSSVTATAPASAAYYAEAVQVSGKSAGTIWADDLFSFRKRDAAALLASGTVTTAQLGGDITAAGKALLDDATAAAQRATLGLAIGTDVQAYMAPLSGADFWSEATFSLPSITTNHPWGAAGAIASGTTTAIITTALDGYHIPVGGVLLRSSASANSGYYIRDNFGAQLWFGSRAMKYQCNAHVPTSLTNLLVRLGFLDTNSASDATDGAYFEISGTTVSAKTAKASTRTTNATTATLAPNVWYTFDIEVDAAGANVRFRITRDSDGASMLDVTNSANIPNTSGNGTGAGVVGINTAGSATGPIIALNRMGLGTLAAFNRARG